MSLCVNICMLRDLGAMSTQGLLQSLPLSVFPAWNPVKTSQGCVLKIQSLCTVAIDLAWGNVRLP
jgi:hypothetical protein